MSGQGGPKGAGVGAERRARDDRAPQRAILKKEPVAGLIVLTITPLIWGLGRFVGHTAERPELQPRRLLAVTVTVVAVSLLAMVIAFVGHPPASLRDLLPLYG